MNGKHISSTAPTVYTEKYDFEAWFSKLIVIYILYSWPDFEIQEILEIDPE